MDANADLEHGLEFERIKENYRTTIIVPELGANVPEVQAAFQELQVELQEFLGHYIPKVVALGGAFGAQAAGTAAESSTHHIARTASSTHYHTAAPHSVAHLTPSVSHENPNDVLSDQATCHQGVVPSRHPSQERKKSPLEAHVANLHEFLLAHAENLEVLQGSLGSQSDEPLEWKYAGPQPRVAVVETKVGPDADDDGHFDALNEQFNMLVLVATFTAGLIVSFLSLVDGLITTRHRVAFNVGMLFSFAALLVHLGNIIVAGRGAAITSQQLSIKEGDRDLRYFRFYLKVCEQLQFAATILFAVSMSIMIFLIFISIAFPLILLFFGIFASLLVFWSAYWKVSITFQNVKFLVKNFRRLRGQTLTYLKAHSKTRGRPTA